MTGHKSKTTHCIGLKFCILSTHTMVKKSGNSEMVGYKLNFFLDDLRWNYPLDFKIKVALHINWQKPTLNAQQNVNPHCNFTVRSLGFSFSLSFCFFYTIVFMISDANYQHLTPSFRHVATTYLFLIDHKHKFYNYVINMCPKQLSPSMQIY